MTFPRQDGDASAGREVFRFETFGNEGFWTDAVRLPLGMMAARITPLKALQLGVQVDMDALDDATRRTLSEQLRADPSGHTSALLNDLAARDLRRLTILQYVQERYDRVGRKIGVPQAIAGFA